MALKSHHPPHSSPTSQDEGIDLSLVLETWIETAKANCRLDLVRKLSKENLGFREVMDYCDALDLKLKSEKFTSKIEKGERDVEVISKIMGKKLCDADQCYREALKKQNDTRRKLKETFGNNTRKTRNIIRNLRQDTRKVIEQLEIKYDDKIKHLKKVYGKNKDEETKRVPEDLEDYRDAKIFSDGESREIDIFTPTVTILGDLEVDSDERAAASLHPKVAILPKLTIQNL